MVTIFWIIHQGFTMVEGVGLLIQAIDLVKWGLENFQTRTFP